MRFSVCTDVVVNAYSELFDRMDLDNDGYLNKSELDQYMMRTEGAPVQDTAYHWLLHKFEGKEGTYLWYGLGSASVCVFNRYFFTAHSSARSLFALVALCEDLYCSLLSAEHTRVNYHVIAPGLSKNAFLRAQQFVFQHTGGDEEKLRNEFRILGYSARYIQCGSLSFERAYDSFSHLGCAISVLSFV
jgi:hypothetical protein